jgi:hypothetical protein
MESIPWFAWILLGAIVFGSLASVVDSVLKHRRKVAEINAGPARHEVLVRLDAIEHRLERIERALTEIPS